MKKSLVLLMALLTASFVFFTACNKSDNTDELKANEQRLLVKYLTDHNITVEPTASGLYYIETDTGTGIQPLMGDMILMNYTLKIVSDKIVATSDKQTAINNNIVQEYYLYGPQKYILQENQYEKGLQEGLLMMKEGSKATMVIPSSLSYGGLGMPWLGVGPYSTLIYEIELLRVIKNPDAFEREQIAAYLDTTSVTVADSTADGLYHIIDKAGSGDPPTTGTIVKVNYKLYLIDGRQLAENNADTPFSYSVGSAGYIEGWDKGIRLTRKGEKCRIIIPWYKAYGKSGFQIIPPYSTLLYILERVD
ncbi:MAG: FKBP-type peptidyl-prolyl cis-trans isomerase [Bacteroidales bacterium]